MTWYCPGCWSQGEHAVMNPASPTMIIQQLAWRTKGRPGLHCLRSWICSCFWAVWLAFVWLHDSSAFHILHSIADLSEQIDRIGMPIEMASQLKNHPRSLSTGEKVSNDDSKLEMQLAANVAVSSDVPDVALVHEHELSGLFRDDGALAKKS